MATNNAVNNSLSGQTGTGFFVGSNSPILLGPNIGTPIAGTLTNCTGLPVSSGISGLGSGIATFLATPTSANLAAALTDETGTGAAVFATSPTLVTPLLGTPTSGTLTNCTGLPISSGVSGLGSGVATFLATPTSANLAAALTDETGTGSAVFSNSPTLVTPTIGAASATSITFTSTTGIVGTTTNNNAAAGSVGEIIESDITTPASLANNTPFNITSISLTAGDWDVFGNVFAIAGTTLSIIQAACHTTSATLPPGNNKGAYFIGQLTYAANVGQTVPIGTRRYSFASTTTVYLVISCTFGSSCTAGGYIGARRVR